MKNPSLPIIGILIILLASVIVSVFIILFTKEATYLLAFLFIAALMYIYLLKRFRFWQANIILLLGGTLCSPRAFLILVYM